MSGRFKQDTNWCVITGAPSSGKTAVIGVLAHRGYAIQTEVAREVINLGLRQGLTLQEIRNDVGGLQRDILEVGLAREMALDVNKTIFLDRGLPDSITYLKIAGLDTMEAVAVSSLFRYRHVFLFDRLPFVHDEVRTESAVLAEKLDGMLEADYRALGYSPIRVPVMPVEERADFVLEKIDSGKTIPVA
jgi:predicted ATPase